MSALAKLRMQGIRKAAAMGRDAPAQRLLA